MAVWRLIRIAGITAAITLGAVALALYYLAARSLPDYAGEREAEGLAAPVEIVRDERAVPHIFARTEADAYFALGYAHAQDRLWSMELTRRLVQGRVTELAGFWGRGEERRAALIRLDVTARSLDLQGRAALSLEHFSPETRALLEAYAAGVNAWLKEVDEGSLGRGAPELFFLGAAVAPWRPVDSVAALKLEAALRSGGAFAELTRARFLTGLGAARAADLFPLTLEGETDRPAALGLGAARPQFWADGGSQGWAAAGTRSATRAPLFASDAHAPLSAPSHWYMARLSFGPPEARRSLMGATLPGAPAVLYGRNADLAWGLAEYAADVGDVFIEQLDPEDPTRYRTPDGWASFARREETMPIGGGEAVAVVLRASRHGPILPLDWPEIAGATPKGHVASIAWTTLATDDVSLEAAIRLSRARSVEEGLRAAQAHVAPPQNLILADRRRVAAAALGRLPRRRPDSLSRGATPARGWAAENDWIGYQESRDGAVIDIPPEGLIAAAGARFAPGAFPGHLGYDRPEPYRQIRLEKLLQNRRFHTLSGFQSIQNDAISESARAALPLIAGRLWAERERESGLRREALDRLADWTGDMDAFLPEPLIYAAWTRALTRRLTADELAPLRLSYEGARPMFLERVYLDPEGAGARWCDDIRTEAVESCAVMASLALDDALTELTSRYGGALGAWRWGRAHEAIHAHQPFGDTSALGALLNIRQETGGADDTLLRGVSLGYGEGPYANRAGAGFRAIYDFADLDRSVFVLSTGQSGHFLSRHYDDFAEIWRGGDYVSFSLGREDAEAGSVGVLRLRPAGTPPLLEDAPSPSPDAAAGDPAAAAPEGD